MKGFIKNSIISTGLFIKDNRLTIIFITLFTIGCLSGTLVLGLSLGKSETALSLLKSYFQENSELSILALFSRNLVSSLLYLGVMYVGGLCAIGLPFIAIIPILKGIALGMIISYQYLYSGIKGFLYCFIILLLPQALCMAVYTIAYMEGIYMSLSVSNGIFNGKPRQIKYQLNFLTFSKRYVIFALAMVAISMLEAILGSVFSKVL
ncbi:MAG: hypothetical protein E7517_00510 [Ruminococcaceae bacterium]|nr:hypothetical protein [Oscillospiraceae bacterium]